MRTYIITHRMTGVEIFNGPESNLSGADLSGADLSGAGIATGWVIHRKEND